MEPKDTITTIEALKAAYPDLTAAIEDNARKEERNRIKSIEDMVGGRYGDIASDAKFDNPCTAEQVAVKIRAAQGKKTRLTQRLTH